MVDRLIYNCKILSELGKIIISHPYLRFCQILAILGLDKDNFYEEPDETLQRIYKSNFLKDKR